jgi:hypothetical protein
MKISGRYHLKQSGNMKGINENRLPIQVVPKGQGRKQEACE